MRVLTWNLFHGRAVPGAGRSLLPEFSAALAGWTWDVALLQEVPPWWPQPLARAAGAQERHALTSRNWLLPVRRFLAERWPDLMKSQGGGCNALLVRGQAIAEHRELVLRREPERRVAHGVRLAATGAWVVNLHATAHVPARAQEDLDRARAAALAWAGAAPLVLGGDLNLRTPRVPGFAHVAARDVDHLFARGLEAAGRAERLPHGTLSDHPPLVVSFPTP
jgi:endonuclease/exonuclease/phosphatase family metal-dependent hydrolase